MNNTRPLPAAQPVSLEQRCRQIDMLLLDVDGVLTDGSIVYADNNVEVKAFHVRDGSALKIWEREGKQAGIITGRHSRVVEVRAAELGIRTVHQGVADKRAVFEQILATEKLGPERVCFVGDDLPDLPILTECGLAATVADACAEVIAQAHYVTSAAGGRGAVREVIELILRCQGRWQAVVDQYRLAISRKG